MEAAVLVLLVEDDPLVLMATEDMISDGGFTVLTATSGQVVIEMLDEGIGKYSALVTDIRLGKGPTGWDLARHARQINPRMPLVYVSGDSFHEWAAQGVPESIMIQKPYAQAQLITAIANLLNASQLPSGGPIPRV